MADGGGGDFAGTICSICYEDLQPLTEDLQSISVCGHVFHELCLQQWFEYCLKAKKHTCPVCKQSCKASNACRLYFQSVGEVSEAVIPRRPLDSEEDAGVLRKEVKKLEVKVSGLSSELERKGKALEEITGELGACKEQAKIEIALKNEALKQKATIQSQLRMKSEEHEKSTYECHKLQERNMALAKELAALKLVSDLELNEEDVLRLATLGNGSNNKDTIDTLGRSLVLQKRSYKELMAKCFALERGEGRYSKKLEKAKEKIVKLKAKVQELETAAEEKEKEYLMSLKVLKRKRCSNNLKYSINSKTDVLTVRNFLSEEQKKQTSRTKCEMDLSVNNSKSLHFSEIENSDANENKAVNCNGSKPTLSLDNERDFISIDDDDALEFIEALGGLSERNCNGQDRDDAALSEPTVAESDVASGIKRDAAMQGKCGLAEPSRIDIDIEMDNTSADAMDEDVTLLDNIKQVQPMVNIRKESPFAIANPGDTCFSGGLLGPDGTHRFLGKWCKRGQHSESTSAKGSCHGDLIAVGADGRGGIFKSLRTPNHTFLGGKENSVSSKRLKSGTKKSSLQSKGCMQIDQFFGRVNH